MGKYIDAEKLKAEIERLQKFNHHMADNAINSNMRNFYDGAEDCSKQLLPFIDFLQQEQDIIVLNKKDWEKQEQFREDKKFGIPLQQEQPNVDFEKELDRIWFDEKFGDNFDNSAVDFANVRWICNYFYELGNNARKEE